MAFEQTKIRNKLKHFLPNASSFEFVFMFQSLFYKLYPYYLLINIFTLSFEIFNALTPHTRNDPSSITLITFFFYLKIVPHLQIENPLE